MPLQPSVYRELEKLTTARGPCRTWIKWYLRSQSQHEMMGNKVRMNWRAHVMGIGGVVEDTTELLNKANEACVEAREQLAKTIDQSKKIVDVLLPVLTDQVQHIRSTRMTLTSECTQMLSALREVSDFFKGSDYAKEIERMEKVLALCAQFKAVKEDGTLDAMIEAALRLATKGST